MKVYLVWEHNGADTMLLSSSHIGAFARGESREAALAKLPHEMRSYLKWRGESVPEEFDAQIIQEKESDLDVRDADSDVLFNSEISPLTMEEYQQMKALALKSAADFHALFEAIPDKNASCLPARKTFYGDVPRTAFEMYEHTKNVNSYYFGEINVDADHDGTIAECRERGFLELERAPDFLENKVFAGSYSEDWSLRKMLRRFLWHDRIHAKAMYRMAVLTFPDAELPNPFCF